MNANATQDPVYKGASAVPSTPRSHTPSQLPVRPLDIGSARRESSRQIKKPRKDFLEESAQHATGGKSRKRPASAQLKFCHNLIKELLSHKKHHVRMHTQ